MTSEPVYQTRWSHPETVWGDVSKDVYDKYETFGYVERRIVYTHRDPIASAEEAVPDVWRTKEFVMSRLIEAAKEPPSSRSVGNSGRPVGDVWRMVLLSDLQEVVHHLKDEATHPAAAQPSRAEVLEEAALLVEQGQETITQVGDGEENRRHITPRRHGNLMGLAYAEAIRALKEKP